MKAVLVDVGGTLWPNRWPSLPGDRSDRIARLAAAVGELSGSEAGELVDVLAALDHPVTEQQMTRSLVTQALRERGLANTVAVDAAIDAMCLPPRGRVDLFPGATDLLRGLAHQGTPVVVVSNVMWRHAEAQRRDFEECGLATFIADYVMSVDVGWRKPHPAFFDAAVAASGAPSPECVLVGDSDTNDIEPARDLGMVAIRVAIEEPPPETTTADHVCRSLHEVAELLLHPPRPDARAR